MRRGIGRVVGRGVLMIGPTGNVAGRWGCGERLGMT